MRRKLSWWLGFQVHLEHGFGVPLSIVVYGEAEFATGRWHTRGYLETAWHFDHGRAELFSLSWNGGEAVPTRSWPSDQRHRYLDPTPKRETTNRHRTGVPAGPVRPAELWEVSGSPQDQTVRSRTLVLFVLHEQFVG